MKKISISDRIKYHYDKILSKGSIHLIGLIGSAISALIIATAGLLVFYNVVGDSFTNIVWDLFSTTINAWMPEYDENVVYMLIQALAAFVGLLFTSFLIGIITNIVEEKLTSLRKGKTRVIEQNHVIVLGFEEGSYELLEQLINASCNEKRTIVVCDRREKDEMEDEIHENLNIPKNIDIICRNIDLDNPVEYGFVVPELAKSVIINIMEDERVAKTTLAVLTYLNDFPGYKTRIVSSVSAGKYLLPENQLKLRNCQMIKTNDFISRFIGHTLTEPGLSQVYKDLFDYEGVEIYFEKIKETVGRNVYELCTIINDAVVLGVKRNGRISLNLPGEFVFEEDDIVILLEENKGSYKINDVDLKDIQIRERNSVTLASKGTILILGYNYKVPTILKELPKNTDKIIIAGYDKEDEEQIKEDISNYQNCPVILHDKDVFSSLKNLEELVKRVDHIAVISDDDFDDIKDVKEDDTYNILMMLKLVEIRSRLNLSYNLTTELQLQNSFKISINHRYSDYVVAFNIISMILVQLEENSDLFNVFNELLSEEGDELYVKSSSEFNLMKSQYTFGTLKQIIISYGYTLIGYGNNNELIVNANNKDIVNVNYNTSLIVMGKK